MARTAASVIADFYDADRDMEAHEATFLRAYHVITTARSRTLGEAIHLWGDGTPAYQATRFLADRQCDADMARALAAYDAAAEAFDQGEISYQHAMDAISLAMQAAE